MQTKPLGRTGREVTVVGIGTAFLGRARNQPTDITPGEFVLDPELGVAALTAGLDAGITLVDTAPFYRTEPFVGAALKQTTVDRSQITVMTKAGRPGVGEFDFSSDGIKRHVEASLERLGLDRIDVVSIHDAVHEGVPYIMSKQGAFGALAELRDQGVVGAIGSACYDPALNADYLETGEFDVAICSASWSMINLTLRQRVLPAAEKYNVGLVIGEPLERGLLAVGYEPGRKYADRNFSPAVLERVQQIQTLCGRYGYRILDVGTLKNRADWVAFDDFEYLYLDPRGDAAPIDVFVPANGHRQTVLVLGGGVIARSELGLQKLERTGWIEVPASGLHLDSTGATPPGDQVQMLRISGEWEGTPHIGVFWAWPQTPLEVHYHDFDEYWFIVSGHTEGETDGKTYQLKPGDLIATTRGYEHGMPNVGEQVTGVAWEPALGPGQRKGHLHRHEHGDPVPSRELN